MAQIDSPHLFYPDGYPGSYYDLRDVVSWCDAANGQDHVLVRFANNLLSPVVFDRTAFEAAKTFSLASGG